VAQVFGLHVWNYTPTGQVAVKVRVRAETKLWRRRCDTFRAHVQFGSLMAASDLFRITVKGRGGHGAVPQGASAARSESSNRHAARAGTSDAIVAASHLVVTLQTIISRNVARK
jgi:metal-dependent amidase/aminoacylase/carboxypeptidase family protein